MNQGLQNLTKNLLVWAVCPALTTQPYLQDFCSHPFSSLILREILNCKLRLISLFIERWAPTAVPMRCTSLYSTHHENTWFWIVTRLKTMKLQCWGDKTLKNIPDSRKFLTFFWHLPSNHHRLWLAFIFYCLIPPSGKLMAIGKKEMVLQNKTHLQITSSARRKIHHLVTRLKHFPWGSATRFSKHSEIPSAAWLLSPPRPAAYVRQTWSDRGQRIVES